ncbi:glutamine-hydrolyzing carbamoyl-phosphate synthase small subunit [Paenibacillus allorhizosphaerae]|uniref:Carbamoyl phosphate synthase small chain n=1 Tax=Paenibacillus allorhizosphaerae TaxID=2849866 RepID=A0ABN7TGV5_9BACL|nr:glutamine-hydrolyzing carbamoyl-phosphate synthase small subunit [Paenibacillus allorhizosphaerae]CAG7621214.1 Carbamoyl-phosphate synthase small chain [Paenibacillus allorhizosphaerae]
MQARLLLEDGTLFTGKAFGSEGSSVGEVVFNTGITGYQEVLSDPSYCGQIVTMTYPLIGNYGIARDDFESIRPYIHGFVVREHEVVPSNWRAEYSLDSLLKEYGIIGISGIDTRMLTRRIRHHGVMKGILTTSGVRLEELMEQLKATPLMTDQVSRVSTKSVFASPGSKERVVLVDFGSKSGILRDLTKRGCDVVVVPQDTTAEQIRRLAPDGILLSNGPGDPKDVPHAAKMIAELLGEFPIFGICLGHQLFALASGADTEKLKFGHRGGNHPVKDLQTGRCYITSQNHGYTVKEESIAGTELEVTHINNNDRTIEGLKHKQHPAFSVQYHPEAAPGPFDSSYLFDDFLSMIREHKISRPQQPRQAQIAAAYKAGSGAPAFASKGELHYAEK